MKKRKEKNQLQRVCEGRRHLCIALPMLLYTVPRREAGALCIFVPLENSTTSATFSVCADYVRVSVCVCVSCLSGSGCAARCLLWALWLWLVACLLALQTTKKELSLFSCVSIRLCVYVHVRAVLANTFCLLAHRSANFPST